MPLLTCLVTREKQNEFHHFSFATFFSQIIAEALEPTPGIIIAEVDLSEVEKVRAKIPSLGLERSFDCYPA